MRGDAKDQKRSRSMDVKVGNVREEGSGRKRAMTRAVEDMME